jgi:hypothetical protein
MKQPAKVEEYPFLKFANPSKPFFPECPYFLQILFSLVEKQGVLKAHWEDQILKICSNSSFFFFSISCFDLQRVVPAAAPG